jgi:hypothetical protein
MGDLSLATLEKARKKELLTVAVELKNTSPPDIAAWLC